MTKAKETANTDVQERFKQARNCSTQAKALKSEAVKHINAFPD